MAVFLFESIGQMKGNNWEARNVVRTGLGLWFGNFCTLAVNVGNTGVWITIP